MCLYESLNSLLFCVLECCEQLDTILVDPLVVRGSMSSLYEWQRFDKAMRIHRISLQSCPTISFRTLARKPELETLPVISQLIHRSRFQLQKVHVE